MSDEMRLRGKAAIVTGGGRGIGRAIALLLAREGAKVVVADSGVAPDGFGADAKVAQQVVKEIEGFGGTALAKDTDVSDWNATRDLVAAPIDAWGRLDIVVNVAGNMRPRTVFDVTEQDFNDVMRVHLNGTLNTSHFASQHWVERGGPGRLINIASRMAVYGHPLMINYSAAKAAIIALTRSCANALVAYGVTSNVILPSAATRMVDSMDSQALEAGRKSGKWKSDAALGTDRDPAHVAPMVAFLASDQAAHVSGRAFGAHGGHYTLWSIADEEREVNLTWPGDYPRMLDEFERKLTAGLSLEDLPMPIASVKQNWEKYEGRPPRWDFKTKPG